DYERTGTFFQQAVRLAQELEDPALHAHSLNRLGNWLVNIGQVAEGLQIHEQALEVFQREQDLAGMAETLDSLGLALAWRGDFVKAAQQQQRAIDLFRLLDNKRGLVSILPNVAISLCPTEAETLHVAVRSPEECERYATEAAQLARQIDW